METVDEKVAFILKQGFNLPYVEYYSHEGTDCFKFDNPYSKYNKSTRVLCPVRRGFSMAIDLMVEWINDTGFAPVTWAQED